MATFQRSGQSEDFAVLSGGIKSLPF